MGGFFFFLPFVLKRTRREGRHTKEKKLERQSEIWKKKKKKEKKEPRGILGLRFLF